MWKTGFVKFSHILGFTAHTFYNHGYYFRVEILCVYRNYGSHILPAILLYQLIIYSETMHNYCVYIYPYLPGDSVLLVVGASITFFIVPLLPDTTAVLSSSPSSETVQIKQLRHPQILTLY